ncbi:MAG: tetratricopeptide repeat protein [Bacteroidota bacterium]
MKRMLLLSVLLLPSLLLAQTAQDSVDMRLLVDSAYNLLYVDLDSARVFAQEVMGQAKAKGMFSYEMNALQTIGFSYLDSYAFDKAIAIFQEGLKQAKDRKDLPTESIFSNSLALVYEQQGKLMDAKTQYIHSIEINRLEGDSVGLCIGLGNLGNVYEALGKQDSAILLHKQAMDIREKRGDSRVHNNYHNLGRIYQQMGRYDLATELYIKAIDKRIELEKTQLAADTYSNLGGLFTELQNHEKSIFYIKKAETINKKLNNTGRLAQCYSLQGTEYLRIFNYTEAEQLFQKALSIYEKLGDVYAKTTDLHNLGSVYLEQDQFEKAISHYQQSIDLKIPSNNERALPVSLTGLGSALSQQGRYQKAEKVLLQANDMATAQHNLTQQKYAAEILAEHYERVGKLKQSLQYQRETNLLKDSIFNQDYTNKMNQLYVSFETEQTKRELLEERIKSQELTQAKVESDLIIARRNTQLLASFVGLSLLVLGTAFYSYRNKQREKSRIAQVTITEQQKGLAAVIHAQEEERKRIAKDLHDGIVQQLGGLKLGLQKVLADHRDTEAKKMIHILDDSTQELRALSHQMMPRALSKLGLIPALQDLLENSLTHTGITYRFEIFGMEEAERFTEGIEISLYRIVQELINNVIKHSDANEVAIQFLKSTHHLALIVEDNGKGFKEEPIKSGIGLMNISSRLDTIDGQVNFESSPEGGTLATIHIPLST